MPNRIDECIGCGRVIVLKPTQVHAVRRCAMCQAQDVRPVGERKPIVTEIRKEKGA